VSIRVDEQTLMFFDPDTRELLRTRPNPLTPAEIGRLRSASPAGPPSQPRTGPIPVQRRASNSAVVMVVGQKIALGRVHAGKTVTIDVTDTELAIHCAPVRCGGRQSGWQIRGVEACGLPPSGRRPAVSA
jgi:hypothetical protein